MSGNHDNTGNKMQSINKEIHADTFLPFVVDQIKSELRNYR